MRPVNWSSPINWSHTLNKDLIGWWLNVPHWQGGTVLRDLVNQNHGVLTNMAQASDWFGPEDRRGGWGALDFVGDGTSDEHVDTGMPDGDKPTGGMTLTCWCKGLASGGSAGSMMGTQGSSGNRGFHFGPNNTGTVFFTVASDATTLFATSVTGHSATVWTRYVGVYVPSTSVTIYRNGIQVTQNTTSVPASIYQANGRPLLLGDRGDQLNNAQFNGLLDDHRMIGRAWTPSECMLDFVTSSTFYPDLLNRRGRRVVVAAAAGGPIAGSLALAGVGI